MKSLISLIENIWNIGVLLFGLAYFGGVGTILYKLGESALHLHERGLVSLVSLNCALQGEKLPQGSAGDGGSARGRAPGVILLG